VDPADPRTGNPYAYARNNPLAFVDPSGGIPIAVDPFAGSAPDPLCITTSCGGGLASFGGGYAPFPSFAPVALPPPSYSLTSLFTSTSSSTPAGLTSLASTPTPSPFGGFNALGGWTYPGGSQGTRSRDPFGPNPGNYVKVEIFGFDVVPLGGVEFASGIYFGRNRRGEFQFGPFVEAGPAVGAALSLDTIGLEFVSNLDELDRSLSINFVLGAGPFNFQGNLDPTYRGTSRPRFVGGFANGAGVGLSLGPLPVEGFFSFTQTRTFDVIGFGRRLLGE
jgi:hypothetical protein